LTLERTKFEFYLLCNKCGKYMHKVSLMGIADYDRQAVKRHYCGDCVLKRLEKYAKKNKCKYVF
jgi:hypothetical protein